MIANKQAQNALVYDAPRYRFHQFGMRNRIEVPCQIGIHHISVAAGYKPVHSAHGISRTPVWPVGVLFRWHVGLEDRLENQHGCHLTYSIRQSRNAERPLFAIRFRNKDPSYCFRTVALFSELLSQFPDPSFSPVCFDFLERQAVHSGCPLVGAAAVVGVQQHVRSVNLVI